MTLTIELTVTILVAALSLINAWALFLINEGKKDRAALWDAHAENRDGLASFREKVARDHVTTEMLTKVEERVIQAIERLADRLDRMFEQGRKQP